MPDIGGSFARGQRGGQGQALMNFMQFMMQAKIQQNRSAETSRHNLEMERVYREREARMDRIFEFQQEQAEIKAAEPEKAPAGDVAYFRRRRDAKVKEIGETDVSIEQMRQDLDLSFDDTGQLLPELNFLGNPKKEQPILDRWNRLHKTRTKKQASLDSLKQQAEKEGINIEFGAAIDTLNVEDPAGLFE